MKRNLGWLLVAATASLSWGCPDNSSSPPPPSTIDQSIFADHLGEPMYKATAEQRKTFDRGRKMALKRFTVDDGLGPDFNVTFCTACHERPTVGGSSPRYRDFFLVGTALDDGTYVALGINGIQDNYSVADPHRNKTEDAANNLAQRNGIPFFGVGAIAAIPESSILANADPDDLDGDGISGRPNYDRGFVGRFGRKAQTVSIEGFIRGPLFNHLGVTTDPLTPANKARLPVKSATAQQQLIACPTCQAAAPEQPTTDEDGVPDPEMGQDDLFDLVSFAMLLGAPKPDPPSVQSVRGRQVFADVACTSCHVPALQGPGGMVPLYSDLLLHDMGSGLADNVTMGVASGREFRTQPLWGIAATGPYLHDGRASTIDEAIMDHGGEASDSRDQYAQLTDDQKADLIAFLKSLGGADQATPGLLPPKTPIADVGDWGGPRHELSADEQKRFLAGRAIFDRNVNPSDGLGLGAGFNGDSCRACHFDPAVGGAGPAGLDVTRQGIVDPSTLKFTQPDPGTMLHRERADRTRSVQDPVCNVIELRQPPTLLGLGLIDEIPDDQITANADPDDADGDGISGKVSMLPTGQIGRFGWKAAFPTLEDFDRDALSNEVGLTLADDANFIGGVAADDDDTADPEFGGKDYADLVYFTKMLAYPPRGKVGATEKHGADVFDAIGCDDCHIEKMTTADGTAVPLYSDLLLHDVAPDGYEGIENGSATMREFRTPPLWGLRKSAPYMHDGLAATVEEAIERHFAEGDASRVAFEGLSDSDRTALVAFLNSL